MKRGETRDAWLLVEIAADSVALELTHNLVALISGKKIDGSSDVDDSTEGLDGVDADPHGIERGLDEALGIWCDSADQKSFGRVTVPAINNGREIDVDDVSITQQVIVRDAVANYLVDAGANRIRVAVVAQAGGRVAMLDRAVVSQLVDLKSGDAWPDMRSEIVHQFGVESAGGSEGLAIRVRRIDRDLGHRPGLRPQQSASERVHKITYWRSGVVKFGPALCSDPQLFATRLKKCNHRLRTCKISHQFHAQAG